MDINEFVKNVNAAKLFLEDSEKETIYKAIQNILTRFEKVAEFDAGNAEQLVNVLNVENVMREDLPVKFIEREELLKQAPQSEEGYYVVPKTVE